MVTADALATQQLVNQNTKLKFSYHKSGSRLRLREPTANDLVALLNKMEEASPEGIDVTSFSVSLGTNVCGIVSPSNIQLDSLDSLLSYVQSSDAHTELHVNAPTKDEEMVHFAAKGIPCEGAIYSRCFDPYLLRCDSPTFYRKMISSHPKALLAYAASAVAGVLFPIGMLYTVHDPSSNAVVGLPIVAVASLMVAASLYSLGAVLPNNIMQSSLEVDLRYAGPMDKKSPVRQEYNAFVHGMKQFKV